MNSRVSLNELRVLNGGPGLVCGPLKMSLEPGRVMLDGKPLKITRREWDLLRILVPSTHKVMSKAMIAHMLEWKKTISQASVEVSVSRLRAKLAPAGITIRCVPGMGYILEGYAGRGN